jgi:hypothetical protein
MWPSWLASVSFSASAGEISKGDNNSFGFHLLRRHDFNSFCQFIRKILCVICGTHRGVKGNDTSRVAQSVAQKAQREPPSIYHKCEA